MLFGDRNLPSRVRPRWRNLQRATTFIDRSSGRLKESQMTKHTDIDHQKVWSDFSDAVNMSPSDLERWLKTEESRENGWKEEDGRETIGHHSGRRIVEIKHKRKADLTENDYAHMQKAVGYVHRHLAQGGPRNDKEHSAWRYSLMNWGHDPLK